MVRKSPVPTNFVSPQVDGNALYNTLLLNLPVEESELLYPQLVFIPLPTREILNEAGAPIKHAYFMNSGLASVLNVTIEGKAVEVGLTGKEGFVGLPLLVGFETSPARVIVQIEGSAFRVNAANLLKLVPECPMLEKRMHRYSQVLAMQASQFATCNTAHHVNERLARWLLMSQDRIGTPVLPLTQEFLSHILGTRRASVTVASSALQRTGLIEYARGSLNIVNRPALKAAACECYAALVQQSAKWESEALRS
jgi:CRP-like cAMP-binding protein